ncbi:Ig-like domain-containing protein [Aquimarina algicola]|uniref:Fibronectin type-III domain-containing protein n=1 Tax=Aquimarina algicola TaxID=2589995 RepID=A0A504J7Y6_9FLAO|nr:Ig-like domain-containing protein [Aquimarina algicola]TPN84705.1 hypothetical protein FHK87_17410 [Aquimarina algicola]
MKYITQSITLLLILLIVGCNDDDSGVQDADDQNSVIIQPEDNDISFNLVNLKWETVSASDNSTIVYDIYLEDIKIKDSNKDTDYTLTKLEADTEYSGRIVPKALPKNTKSKAIAKLSPISFSFKTKQFSNPNAPTPEVSGISVNNITGTQGTLTWNTATISDGSEISYNVYLEGDLIESNLKNTSFTFENLEPKTLYKGVLLAISTNQKSTALDFEFTTLPSSDEVALTGFSFYRGTSASFPASDWAQLIPIFSPVNANAVDLNWTSSDESIAIVDESGYLNTKGIGVVTITATSVDDPQISKAIEITVTERRMSNERFISTQPRRSSILIGATQKIQINDFNRRLDDTRDFVFTSSDTSIATVDSEGNVTGIAIGTVAITTTSASNPDLTDTVMLRVVENPIPIKEFIFYYENPRSLFVGQSQGLYPKILPIDATNQDLIFTSTNPSIIEVKNGSAKAVSPGNASVIVTSVADNSVSETRDFSAISDPITLNQDTGLYTAPANSEVTMQLFGFLDVNPQSNIEGTSISLRYSVTDSSGQELLDQNYNQPQLEQVTVFENIDGEKFADLVTFPIKFQMPADGEVTITLEEITLFDSQDFSISLLSLDINNNQGPIKNLDIPVETIILN